MTDLNKVWNEKPNIVRVIVDEEVKAGRFYKVMYDKPTNHEFVTNLKDGTYYTYLLAEDELQAWATAQRMLDIAYGND